MARLRSITRALTYSDTPPRSGPGSLYPIVVADFRKTGAPRADLFSALAWRVLTFSGSMTGSATATSGGGGTSIVQTNSGASTVPLKHHPSAPPYTEKEFAGRMEPATMEQIIQGKSGGQSAAGTWVTTIDAPPNPIVTHTDDSLMQALVGTSGAVAVGDTLYIQVSVQMRLGPGTVQEEALTVNGDSSYDEEFADKFQQIGAMTLNIPCYDQTINSFVIPLFGLKKPGKYKDFAGFSITQSINGTYAPSLCQPYGLDPGNPNIYTTTARIWNDNGTLAPGMNPLTS